MKKLMKLLVVVASLLGMALPVWAIPTLQLDILGGIYDSSTQTIIPSIASGDPFTLYAYLIPDGDTSLGDSFFISAALIPNPGSTPMNLGSFSFYGLDISVTSDMDYGTPEGLQRHGIFPTYFTELEFHFSNNQITPYDTQLRAIAGNPIPTSGSGMYYNAFTVNTGSLASGYDIHFDLYHRNGSGRIDEFAPFSHDAQSVPEPTAILLLGAGLIGLAGFARWKKYKD
jgi:hypothetical protein